MSIEGQGHFLPYIFQVLYVLCFTGPRYQVSVYRTIGPLVLIWPYKEKYYKESEVYVESRELQHYIVIMFHPSWCNDSTFLDR